MPAHMGLKGRISAFNYFVWVNTSQSTDAKVRRNVDRTANKILRMQGQETGPDRTHYYSLNEAAGMIREYHVQKREIKCANYDELRLQLNYYDPDGRFRDNAVPKTEWDLYLKPGTTFDQFLRQYFADQIRYHGPEFRIYLILKRDKQRLKRLEGVLPSGRVDILWTAAH